MVSPRNLRAAAVRDSGLSIYDDLSAHPELFFDIRELESLLDEQLRGEQWDYPIRTRSKVAKGAVAAVMGYPIPSSFRRTQPRFPGQNLDISVQMADNLQIWNEEVDPGRRYALIRVTEKGVVTKVRVVTGEVIALWDRTGTLTSKFQAKHPAGTVGSTLVSATDTPRFLEALGPTIPDPEELRSLGASHRPVVGFVLPIKDVYARLKRLEGVNFADPGVTQDRPRGVILQQLACEYLGIGEYADAGQFPDLLCQALEVKLQLSPTIDLGLVLPSSGELAEELGHGLRHADTRYAIVYGSQPHGESTINLEAVVVTTGEDFFEEFQQFEGNVQNRKLQIPLPRDLFDTE